MREKQDSVMMLMVKNIDLRAGTRAFWRIERDIISLGDLPLVIESSLIALRETSLTPELSWGKFAISPMGLFRQIMNSIRSPSLCNGSITVYDGKRAYAVKLNGNRAQGGFAYLDILNFKEPSLLEMLGDFGL